MELLSGGLSLFVSHSFILLPRALGCGCGPGIAQVDAAESVLDVVLPAEAHMRLLGHIRWRFPEQLPSLVRSCGRFRVPLLCGLGWLPNGCNPAISFLPFAEACLLGG